MKKTILLLLTILSTVALKAQTFYKGADLSYVNQMEDCGATYYENNSAKDPFTIMADHGANIVRVRLWHNPLAYEAFPTPYSTYEDVVKTITRAKSEGMHVLLDFHYSDHWTDPGKQGIPSAWAHLVDDISALETEMYNYTYQVLTDLNSLGLMPEMVQVGNETNGQMLSAEGADVTVVDWARQSAILNAGIAAVRAAGNVSSIQPKIVLHIADPSQGDYWFGNVVDNGVNDFDIMGFSFYPEWHGGDIGNVGNTIAYLKNKFNKDVLFVEVGLPYTLDWNDDAANMLSAMPNGYEVNPNGQRDWLIDLTTEMYNKGGIGVIYWEPAWVSTGCATEWGIGSHWENGTFFDFNNELLLDGGIQFLSHQYVPIQENNVTFRVQMPEGATEAFITGDFSGTGTWQIIPMENQGNNTFTYSTTIPVGSEGAYHFLNGNNWEDRENVPSACALMWGEDRKYTIVAGENLFSYEWASCSTPTEVNVTFKVDMTGVRRTDGAYLTGDFPGGDNWQIIPMNLEGNNIYSYTLTLPIGSEGAFYFLKRNNWNNRETVPSECALMWNSDRKYIVGTGNTVLQYVWESCEGNSSSRLNIADELDTDLIKVYPIPTNDVVNVEVDGLYQVDVYSAEGQLIKSINQNVFDISELQKGVYILRVYTDHQIYTRQVIKQ